MASEARTIFDTHRRVRLGIWGLSRGAGFAKMCGAVNIDVVAGCDTNAEMRDRFAAEVPEVLVTDSVDEFLGSDIDAVLVATYCPDHGTHAIRFSP